MENQNNKPTTLEAIKEQAADHFHNSDWATLLKDYREGDTNDEEFLHDFNNVVDTIATRYAAKKSKAFSEWLDKNQFHMNKWGDWDNGKTLMTTETAYRIFEKETAHYDNQNTDV